VTSGDNNFNHFAENQLTKFSARDAGDFSDVEGAREMAPKCGSLPRDAGDLVGLCKMRPKLRLITNKNIATDSMGLSSLNFLSSLFSTIAKAMNKHTKVGGLRKSRECINWHNPLLRTPECNLAFLMTAI